MRPLKLVMENFGAYRNRTEIDFTTLASMFLVCGKTGSGKTTIFDALTYALYGKAPGARGGLESQLCSQHAALGEIPRVEFEFQLGAELYRAVRQPPYKRVNRRGAETEVASQAALYRFDPAVPSLAAEPSISREGELLSSTAGPVPHPEPSLLAATSSLPASSSLTATLIAQGSKDVGEEINRRIGLTADEFSKIILLPQGEFQRFLEMDSTERVKVLEKLFPVDLHEKTTTITAERYKTAKNDLEQQEAEIKRLEELAGHDPEVRLATLDRELETASRERKLAFDCAGSAKTAFELGRKEAERAKKEAEAQARVEELESRIPEMTRESGRLEKARHADAALPALERQGLALARESRERKLAKEIQAEQDSHEASSQEIRDLELAMDSMEKEARDLDMRRGTLEAADAAWKEALKAGAEKERAQTEVAAAELKVASLVPRRLELEALIRNASISPGEEELKRAQADSCKAGLEAVLASIAAHKRLADAFSLLTAARKSANEAEILARSLAEAARSASAALETADALMAANRAAAMAAELQEGNPCPVCGSTNHPAPARAEKVPPSIAERDKLAKAARQARDNENQGSANLQASLAIVSERRQALAQAADSCSAVLLPGSRDMAEKLASWTFPPESCQESRTLLAAIEDRLNEDRLVAEKDLQVAAEALKDLDSRRATLEKLRKELESLRSQETAMAEVLAQARSLLAAREAALNQASGTAGGEDPGPALVWTRERSQELRADLAKGKTRCDLWHKRRTVLAENLKDAGHRLAEAAEESLAAAAVAQNVLAGHGFATEEELRTCLLAPTAIRDLEKNIRTHDQDLAGARASLKALKTDKDSSALQTGPGVQEPGLDLAALESVWHDAQRKHEDLVKTISSLTTGKESLARTLADLGTRRKEAEKVRETAQGLASLATLLSGNLPGLRLPFKNFALFFHFRAVVQNASRRLAQMSDGRYSLLAEEGVAHGQGKIGLGISVRDAYTGRTRPAGTLSGGERFLTSISLAFGLSDTIISRSGGVNLDSVFIDEGFGSLDEEALDRAITVLDRMRGDRIIGIVSHVAELRSRIPSQILVEKGRAGSSLSVVAG